eukprot:6510743-Alexandrium_andersonii.AAC.1
MLLAPCLLGGTRGDLLRRPSTSRLSRRCWGPAGAPPGGPGPRAPAFRASHRGGERRLGRQSGQG